MRYCGKRQCYLLYRWRCSKKRLCSRQDDWRQGQAHYSRACKQPHAQLYVAVQEQCGRPYVPHLAVRQDNADGGQADRRGYVLQHTACLPWDDKDGYNGFSRYEYRPWLHYKSDKRKRSESDNIKRSCRKRQRWRGRKDKNWGYAVRYAYLRRQQAT